MASAKASAASSRRESPSRRLISVSSFRMLIVLPPVPAFLNLAHLPFRVSEQFVRPYQLLRPVRYIVIVQFVAGKSGRGLLAAATLARPAGLRGKLLAHFNSVSVLRMIHSWAQTAQYSPCGRGRSAPTRRPRIDSSSRRDDSSDLRVCPQASSMVSHSRSQGVS